MNEEINKRMNEEINIDGKLTANNMFECNKYNKQSSKKWPEITKPIIHSLSLPLQIAA